jgi:DNA-binding transcriptional MerR regulator
MHEDTDMKNPTIAEAAGLLEIETGQLREWISRGYINPAYPATRRGSANMLDKENIYQIALFDHLLKLGLSRVKAAKLIRVQEQSHNQDKEILVSPLSDSKVHSAVNQKKSELMISTSKDFDDLFVINFKKIKNRIDEILSES